MFSSVVSTLLASLISFLMVPPTDSVPAPSPCFSPLIHEVCFDTGWDFDPNLCAHILRSDPQIESAKTLFDLSMAIMRAGQENTTGTMSHIESVLKDQRLNHKVKGALKECRSSYDLAAKSFTYAMSEVEDDNDPQTASYDLLVGCTDDLHPCTDAVTRERVDDQLLLNGNAALRIYGLSAFEAVNRL